MSDLRKEMLKIKIKGYRVGRHRENQVCKET